MKHSILLFSLSAVVLSLGAPHVASAQSTDSRDPRMKEYVVVPVPQGRPESGGKNTLTDATVKNREGQPVGTLDKLIMDPKSGKIEYGVIALKDSERLVPLAWSDFNVNREDGRIVLNATKEQLQPAISRRDIKGLSPDLWEYLDDIVQKPLPQR